MLQCTQGGEIKVVSQEIIVEFHADVPAICVDEVIARNGLRLLAPLPEDPLHRCLVAVDDPNVASEKVTALQNCPEVACVSHNYACGCKL